ncbi:unnamed protein product [Urochloa humidicola]
MHLVRAGAPRRRHPPGAMEHAHIRIESPSRPITLDKLMFRLPSPAPWSRTATPHGLPFLNLCRISFLLLADRVGMQFSRLPWSCRCMLSR